MVMVYLRLFYEFFKAGLFAIGGGLATLPFLSSMADKTGWFTQSELADMIAVSESTPGAIGINMATYAGFKTAGIPGALIATIGLACPSVIIIMLIARFLQSFSDNAIVKAAFYGLRAASVGLIAAAGFLVVKIALLDIDAFTAGGGIASLFKIKEIIMAAVLWLAMKKINVHPVVFIGISLVIGILLRMAGA